MITHDYHRSLTEHANRHLGNVATVLTERNPNDVTMIFAGNESVTDGTVNAIEERLPEAAAHAVANGMFYEVDGANHNFGHPHTTHVAEIMKARAPVLRPQLTLGSGVIRALRIS